MKPEEQRIALAEWAGYTRLIGDPWKSMKVLAFIPPRMSIEAFIKAGEPAICLEQLPDYLNDLNAVHLLEMKLPFEQAEQFEDELCDIVVKYNEQQEKPAPWRFAVAHATAAQRCKALLRTLNLWKP